MPTLYDFDADLELGTQDDGPALQKVLQEKIRPVSNNRAVGDLLTIEMPDEELRIETSVEPRDVNNILLLKPKTRSYTLGPNQDGILIPASAAEQLRRDKDESVRNRVQWQLQECFNWRVCQGYTQSCHPVNDGRNTNYYLEGQPNWRGVDSDHIEFYEHQFLDSWANWCDVTALAPYQEMSDDWKWTRCIFNRNGRQGFHCSGLRGGVWDACEFYASSGSILHSETSATTPDRVVIGNWRMQGCLYDMAHAAPGYLVHVNGGTNVSGIYVIDNVVVNGTLAIYIQPMAERPNDVERVSDIHILGNEWNKPSEGMVLLQVKDSRLLRFDSQNKGPYRKTYGTNPVGPTKAIRLNDVEDAQVDTSGMYRAA